MKRTIRNFKETIEIRSSLFVRLRSSRYLPIAVLSAVCLTGACIHIWQRVQVLELVRQVSALKAENQALAIDVRKVYSEASALSMSSRIQTFAVDSLGLNTVAASSLYTLMPQDEKPAPTADDLDVVLAAVKRVTDYIPSVTQTQANAGELRNPIIDSLANRGSE